jgi:hypothetical protein
MAAEADGWWCIVRALGSLLVCVCVCVYVCGWVGGWVGAESEVGMVITLQMAARYSRAFSKT